MQTDYDKDKFYLGKLCIRGHDYNGTGKNLRYKSNSNCVECRIYYGTTDAGKESRRKYYKRNKVDIQREKRIDYIKNRDSVRKRSKEYYIANIQKARERQKLYYYKNKDKIVAYQKIYEKKQRENNSQSAIRNRLRKRINHALREYSLTGKIMSSIKYGIDYGAIIAHLGPHPNTLGIKGKYEIDHILPLSSFDLNDPKQIKLAFAPENHQWLLAHLNRSKRNNIGSQLNIKNQPQLRAAINAAG